MGIWYLTPVGEGLNCQTEVSIILDDLRADVQYVFPALLLVLLTWIQSMTLDFPGFIVYARYSRKKGEGHINYTRNNVIFIAKFVKES